MPEPNPETHFSFSLDNLSGENTGCGEPAPHAPRQAEPLPGSGWVTATGSHREPLGEFVPNETRPAP